MGIFLCAGLGVVAGRYIPLPGELFAILAAAALCAIAFRPLRGLWPLAIALTFATAQAWQYRQSPAVRLAKQLSEAPQACEAIIEVLDAPHLSVDSQRCRFPARLLSLTVGGREHPEDCRILVLWNGTPPAYGERYTVRASIANCPPQRNPGAFDYSAWLANSGIHSQLDVPRHATVRLLGRHGNFMKRFAIASCAWIEHTISLGLEGTPEAVLIKAMTVGDTSDAPDSLKAAFRETGTFHLFSVSGLHVGIVALLLWAVFGMFGVEQRRSVLLIIPCLFFYALVTGLSAASLRAAIMLSVLATGLLLDRAPTALNSLGAAGLALLAWDSNQLFSSGFQLSFGAVAAICLIAASVQKLFTPWITPDPFLPTKLVPAWHRRGYELLRSSAVLIAVSFAAWAASLPLIVYYFHLISFSSIPANLLAVPLSTGILALSATSLIAGLFSPWLASVFNHANYLLAKTLFLIVNTFAAIPGSSIYIGHPDTIARIVVLDAAGGGAAAIFVGRHTWLVDGGSDFFASAVTLPFLRMNGVNRLDAVILTHGDVKHLGGFGEISTTLRPRLVLDSGLPDRSPTRQRILAATPIERAESGKEFLLRPSAKITVLYPPPLTDYGISDDKALVLRLEVGHFSALLMSDAGVPTEQWLLAHAAQQLPCDVIVMGRHISGLSGDPEFLHVARPQAVIATAASFPDSERIRPEWARAVSALGIALFRQDETGAVTVTAHERSFTVTPYLSTGGLPQTFPDAHSDSVH